MRGLGRHLRAAQQLQGAKRRNVQFAVSPARRFCRGCLRQRLVDDGSQGCDATSAIWTATKAFVHGAGSPRADPAVDNILDFCVAKDIARTHDHKDTPVAETRDICKRLSNPMLNIAQDQNEILQQFQSKAV